MPSSNDSNNSNNSSHPATRPIPDPNLVDLDALYAPPTLRIQQGVLPRLADFHKAYLAQATFFCLATGDASGLDASPRGGPAGFVHVLDEQTIAFADWPGNNRIASLRNLQQDDRLAMLFLFPGLDVFMRINGRGRISTDGDLLNELHEGTKVPKTATVVRIDEVLYHCGRAIHRAGLWNSEGHPDRHQLPTVGQVMAGIARLRGDSLAPEQVTQADEHYAHVVRQELY